MNKTKAVAIALIILINSSMFANSATVKNNSSMGCKVWIGTASFTNRVQGTSLQFWLNPGETKTVQANPDYCLSTEIVLTDLQNNRYTFTLPITPNKPNGYYNGNYSFIIKSDDGITFYGVMQ